MENRMYISIFLGTLLLVWGADCQAMKTQADSPRRWPMRMEKKDWMLLRERISADPQMPDREDVLQLMDYHRNKPERCEHLLRRLNGGKAYCYIVTYVLPLLHIPVKQPLPFLVGDEAKPKYIGSCFELPGQIVELIPAESEEDCPMVEHRVIFALKNNLLYDVALAPNIEVEVPVSKHWSVNAEYKCPWWVNSKKNFCYQLLSGGVEGRYWLGDRNHNKLLMGHFLGVYAEGGIYDFQFSGEGYQSDYYVASGLTYGYVRKLARHLSLEFSLGMGYLTTNYRRYASFQEQLVHTNSGHYRGLALTKAKISLVWLITSRR